MKNLPFMTSSFGTLPDSCHTTLSRRLPSLFQSPRRLVFLWLFSRFLPDSFHYFVGLVARCEGKTRDLIDPPLPPIRRIGFFSQTLFSEMIIAISSYCFFAALASRFSEAPTRLPRFLLLGFLARNRTLSTMSWPFSCRRTEGSEYAFRPRSCL